MLAWSYIGPILLYLSRSKQKTLYFPSASTSSLIDFEPSLTGSSRNDTGRSDNLPKINRSIFAKDFIDNVHDTIKESMNKWNPTSRASPQLVSLKRAVEILKYLTENLKQPHWSMSPFIKQCRDFELPLPWSDESISRLLYFLFYCVCLYPYDENAVAYGSLDEGSSLLDVSNTVLEQVNLANRRPSTSTNLRSSVRSRHGSVTSMSSAQSSILLRRPTTASNTMTSISEQQNANLKRSTLSAFPTINNSSSTGAIPSSSNLQNITSNNTPGPIQLAKRDSLLNNLNNEQNQNQSNTSWHQNIKKKLKLFWNEDSFPPTKPIPTNTKTPKELLMNMPSASYIFKNKFLKFPDMLNFHTAHHLASSKTMMLNFHFIIIILEAWEAERAYIYELLENAEIRRSRRNAISKPCTDEEIAFVPTAIAKIALKRIINWHKSDDITSIDFDQLRENIMNKTIDLDVPAELLSLSNSTLYNLLRNTILSVRAMNAYEYHQDKIIIQNEKPVNYFGSYKPALDYMDAFCGPNTGSNHSLPTTRSDSYVDELLPVSVSMVSGESAATAGGGGVINLPALSQKKSNISHKSIISGKSRRKSVVNKIEENDELEDDHNDNNNEKNKDFAILYSNFDAEEMKDKDNISADKIDRKLSFYGLDDFSTASVMSDRDIESREKEIYNIKRLKHIRSPAPGYDTELSDPFRPSTAALLLASVSIEVTSFGLEFSPPPPQRPRTCFEKNEDLFSRKHNDAITDKNEFYDYLNTLQKKLRSINLNRQNIKMKTLDIGSLDGVGQDMSRRLSVSSQYKLTRRPTKIGTNVVLSQDFAESSISTPFMTEIIDHSSSSSNNMTTIIPQLDPVSELTNTSSKTIANTVNPITMLPSESIEKSSTELFNNNSQIVLTTLKPESHDHTFVSSIAYRNWERLKLLKHLDQNDKRTSEYISITLRNKNFDKVSFSTLSDVEFQKFVGFYLSTDDVLFMVRKLQISEIPLNNFNLTPFFGKCQNLSFLVHLNICGSKVGDVICKKLLDNLYLGGCHITLKALELSDCNISLSNNTMDVLTKFSQLR